LPRQLAARRITSSRTPRWAWATTSRRIRWRGCRARPPHVTADLVRQRRRQRLRGLPEHHGVRLQHLRRARAARRGAAAGGSGRAGRGRAPPLASARWRYVSSSPNKGANAW